MAARTTQRALPKPRRGNFGHSPLLVFYEVTQACDLVCNHCRACAQPTAHPDELAIQSGQVAANQILSQLGANATRMKHACVAAEAFV
jgi:MoaA/NifB/PqqE/SkfB family radical SAM enzyme